MKRTGTGRVLAVLLLGVARGIYIHFDETRWMVRGRDAFLAYHSRRFDTFTHTSPLPIMLVVGILLATMNFGLYELVAAGITRLLPPIAAEE